MSTCTIEKCKGIAEDGEPCAVYHEGHTGICRSRAMWKALGEYHRDHPWHTRRWPRDYPLREA